MSQFFDKSGTKKIRNVAADILEKSAKLSQIQ